MATFAFFVAAFLCGVGIYTHNPAWAGLGIVLMLSSSGDDITSAIKSVETEV
ncbi:hypothetical protein [Edaphobacter aggregans]|uniref:hypothetical protein n=1 Tax=Edaphobacter aggregans TaxID=570835 RepID=UPI0012FA6EB6|nr:hypothetical protein [Edaphobacter aggregans]